MESIKRDKQRKEFDIYDAAMPLYILSKILGLAPFSLQGKRFKRSYVPHFGAFAAIRIIGLLSIMTYVAVLLEQNNLDYDIGGIAIRSELYLGVGLTGAVLVLAVLNQNLVIKAIKLIIRIDGEMRQINIDIRYENARRFCFFQNLGMFSIFVTKGIIQTFSASSIFMGVFSVFNLVDYLNTIMLFQYTDFILLLRQRYIWLNRQLKFLHLSNRPFYLNEFKPMKPKKWQDRSDGSLLLQKIGRIHNELYETGEIINKTYSLQLLLTVGVRFLMVTTQLLNTYKSAVDGSKDSTSMVTFALAGVYIILHTLKVFMVASLSDNTAEKARQTGIRLHKIWDSTPELKRDIQYFSLQILQQNINFSAGGFFTLNYELMYNMLGALATYLIILIQFDTAKQDPNPCNSTNITTQKPNKGFGVSDD